MHKALQRLFTEDQIRAIAHALGNSLTGSEINDLFHLSRVTDALPNGTKWRRIYYSLWNKQRDVKNRTNILQFVRLATQPARYVSCPEI